MDKLASLETTSGYVCQENFLVNLHHLNTFEESKAMLVQKIGSIMDDLKKMKGCPIDEFYIGKTYIDCQLNYKDLKSDNPDTWVMTGINNRWNEHSKKSFGKDGLIVFAAIQDHQVPTGIVTAEKHASKHQQYTLSLENALILHYINTAKDGRCKNAETYNSGTLSANEHPGYVLYFAFKFLY